MAEATLHRFRKNLALADGGTLPGAELICATYGTLNAARDNAVLFPTRFGASHEQNEFLIGKGRALDPERCFIIVPNMLGNGVSSSPSNTAPPHDGPRFPPVAIADNVAFQHEAIADAFAIERFRLVMGWSMGAQQAYHWAVHHAEMAPTLLAICGSARTAPHNTVFLESLRAALKADAAFADGDYEAPPVKGLRAMGRVYAGWAYSQAWYRERCYERMGFTSLDDFLVRYWDALFEVRKANDLLAMIATWIANDVSAGPRFGGDLEAALGAIEAETVLMPCETDLYFPVADNEAEQAMIPNAELRPIASIWGHMAGAGQNEADTAFIDREIGRLIAA